MKIGFFLLIIVTFMGCKKESEESLININRLYRCFYNGYDESTPAGNFYMKFTSDDDLINIWCDQSPQIANTKRKGDELVHSADYTLKGKQIEILSNLSGFTGHVSNDTIYLTYKGVDNLKYDRYYVLYKE